MYDGHINKLFHSSPAYSLLLTTFFMIFETRLNQDNKQHFGKFILDYFLNILFSWLFYAYSKDQGSREMITVLFW